MRKCVIHFGWIVLFCMILFNEISANENDICNQFSRGLGSSEYQLQTGDLIIWASGDMDSVIIQKFTEGDYSHVGMIWIDPINRLWLVDVHPGLGLRRQLLDDFLIHQRNKLVAIAAIRFKGELDREEIKRRIEMFWQRKDQISFDQGFAIEPDMNYASLLEGKAIRLYCTEFVYFVYEGASSGAKIFVNDYDRVYEKKNIFEKIQNLDQDIINEFQFWLGIKPVEQFQIWLTSHQVQVLLSVNGMLRTGSYEFVYEMKDKSSLKPGAKKFLELDIK
ncbi:MAG: YiiX/YebB-like N1pC/P60 family cysteine hydrolase [Chlamydiota bacterium]|nr:YiiX/YebB-like N1pC/P60 family cysteine hydrolase [Chlamydiota bacterium]